MLLEILKQRLKEAPKGLIKNRGYKRYLTVERGGIKLNLKKVEAEKKYDGKEDELKKLMWVLEIEGSKDHAYKIGMGKPIVLRSVQISVKGVKISQPFRAVVAIPSNRVNVSYSTHLFYAL